MCILRTIVTNLGLVTPPPLVSSAFTPPDAASYWCDKGRRSPLLIATALAASRATCAASAKIAAEVVRESTCTAPLGDRQAAAVAAGDEDIDAITFEGDVYGW